MWMMAIFIPIFSSDRPGKMNLQSEDVKDKRKLFTAGQKISEMFENAGNHRDLFFRGIRKSRKILSRGRGGHRSFLLHRRAQGSLSHVSFERHRDGLNVSSKRLPGRRISSGDRRQQTT
jgi:hypothetical protein